MGEVISPFTKENKQINELKILKHRKIWYWDKTEKWNNHGCRETLYSWGCSKKELCSVGVTSGNRIIHRWLRWRGLNEGTIHIKSGQVKPTSEGIWDTQRLAKVESKESKETVLLKSSATWTYHRGANIYTKERVQTSQKHGIRSIKKERSQLLCPPKLKSPASAFHWLNPMRREFKGAWMMRSTGSVYGSSG